MITLGEQALSPQHFFRGRQLDFMTRIHLETPRLLIREYTDSDIATHHRLTQAAFDPTATHEQSEAWMAWTVRNYRMLESLHQPPYGDYAIVLNMTGVVMGGVGLVPSIVPWGVFDAAPGQSPDLRVSPEFGLFWALLPEYRGQGYATEAGKAIIDYAFNILYARRIVATTEHDNHASMRVMEKLGMTLQRNPGTEPFWLQVVGVLEAE